MENKFCTGTLSHSIYIDVYCTLTTLLLMTRVTPGHVSAAHDQWSRKRRPEYPRGGVFISEQGLMCPCQEPSLTSCGAS